MFWLAIISVLDLGEVLELLSGGWSIPKEGLLLGVVSALVMKMLLNIFVLFDFKVVAR